MGQVSPVCLTILLILLLIGSMYMVSDCTVLVTWVNKQVDNLHHTTAYFNIPHVTRPYKVKYIMESISFDKLEVALSQQNHF